MMVSCKMRGKINAGPQALWWPEWMVSDRRYAIRVDSDQRGTLVAGAHHTYLAA